MLINRIATNLIFTRSIGVAKEPSQGQGIAANLPQEEVKVHARPILHSAKARIMEIVQTPAKKIVDPSISPMEKLNRAKESVSVSDSDEESFKIHVVGEKAEEPLSKKSSIYNVWLID